MIISHKYKFIYVKTVKTASTSLEAYLSPYCGEQDIFTPVNPPIEGHIPRNYKKFFSPLREIWMARGKGTKRTLRDFCYQRCFFNHMPAKLIRSRISPQIWKTYYKFTVERNPWDKTLSHYRMENVRAGGALSLEQYFQKNIFPSDFFRYADDQGRLLVDHIIRYEELGQQLGELFGRLGIPFERGLDRYERRLSCTDSKPYREVFSGPQKDAIAKAFEKEITLLRYEF